MAASFSDSSSPNSVLTPQHKKLLSGKEVEEAEEEVPKRKKQGHGRRRLRKGKTTSRSLSDLEFKELKGFMDLGFVFSEEDKDPELVSLIPGLQKKKKSDEGLVCTRPYLSEAWGELDKRNVNVIMNPLLLNWRVPTLGNEIDMKDNLRFWAHTVASIAR